MTFYFEHSWLDPHNVIMASPALRYQCMVGYICKQSDDTLGFIQALLVH